MSEEDRRIFYFDVRDIDWKEYFFTYVLGARRFILKDDPSTLPIAKDNLNRFVCWAWKKVGANVTVFVIFIYLQALQD